MAITTELRFQSKVGYDGTLDGFVRALAELVEQARAAGAPDHPKMLFTNEGSLYGEALPRYASVTVMWQPEAVERASSTPEGGE